MAVSTCRPGPTDPAGPPDRIPPLENGDRLSRPEFERRYDAMPGPKKAELIEGEVYLGARVRARQHGVPHAQLVGWLGTYIAGTPGLEAGDSGSIWLDLDNIPQPDAFLMIEAERGGQARISPDDYVEGAPEWIGEVAASSVSIEMGKKLRIYRRNGVREYIVWRVQDRAIDWFVLREGTYELLAPGADGLLRSEVFPGLWLDPDAPLRGDLATVLDVVRRGVASPEHADFVARLQGA